MTSAPRPRHPRRVRRAVTAAVLLGLACPLTLTGGVVTAAAQSAARPWTGPPVDSVVREEGAVGKKVPVAACVPERLHSKAISFTASDGVRLSGLVLGSGPRGVVLSHENGNNICSWLGFAEELAAANYQVLVYDQRNALLGASEQADDFRFDLDVEAAVQELRDRGVTHVLAGGASMGGTATATVAPKIHDLVGLLILSSPSTLPPDMTPLPGLAKVTVPSFFAAATGDMTFVDEVRALYEASGAKNKQIHILDGGAHGVLMMADGEQGARLHDRALAFVEDAFRQADVPLPPAPPADTTSSSAPTRSPVPPAEEASRAPQATGHRSEEPDISLSAGIGVACVLLAAAIAGAALARRHQRRSRPQP
ncbi:alpha/beta hydrolase [Streptomyces sp. JJ38]|uniref:alpha/beta hydrolase n=1 Tax=Streptomyces sp. JJ38 TaxID=2738128 RepID=UPI001C572C91|nr:alpha/beta hydrolase [Streptomyces sp. JJ38]MBW1599483.1 alpha/beta hydrolase [Streptomyces sp. JJ38]